MSHGTDSNFGTVSIGTSAVLVVDARSRRDDVIIQNVHASNVLYLGPNSTVATSTGIKLAAGESVSVPSRGSIYGIASGASTDVRFWEVY